MSGLVDHLLSTPAWITLLVVLGLPLLESSVFVGFVFPGESAVVLGGVAASLGHVPLAAVIAAAIIGAVVGDSIGYLVGRRYGRRLLDSSLGRWITSHHLDRAEQALHDRGGRAVFLGRFTVALRVMVPGLAGMARMPYRRFALANATGGAIWGAAMAVAGYLAGSSYQTVEHDIAGAGVVLLVLVVAGYVALHVVRRRREEHQQEAQG